MRRTTISALLGALLGVAAGCEEKQPPTPAGARPTSSAVPIEQSLLRICNEGNDEACDKLIAKYVFGDGLPKSDANAAGLSERLCKEGRMYFCPTYAFHMHQGLGVPRDVEGGRKLLVDTCDEDLVGCSDYGQLFATGAGVEKNLELGLKLLDKACKHGDAKACDRHRAASPAGLPVRP